MADKLIGSWIWESSDGLPKATEPVTIETFIVIEVAPSLKTRVASLVATVFVNVKRFCRCFECKYCSNVGRSGFGVLTSRVARRRGRLRRKIGMCRLLQVGD
ncbi:hypothetical protein JG688_00003886 [Phytophthora aleatoria]|uniref:Uncharacterized protein n=1 Tax=Phytophthora aleatoria TaxID=2496075 RepID=A0A8J5ISC7_9STRA|nr:hypothetical protein JG688_00003886 [Phytophthora aleatoria]